MIMLIIISFVENIVNNYNMLIVNKYAYNTY